MNNEFVVGEKSLEVCKKIVKQNKEILKVRIVAHEICYNWGQKNETDKKKLANFLVSFNCVPPLKEIWYFRTEFIKLRFSSLPKLKKGCVWSFTSKVICCGNKVKHVPMMNFHIDGNPIKEIEGLLHFICGKKKGVILETGRYYHYYGNFLLTKKEWIDFMAKFLIPIIFVRSRYIGLCLYEGYCSLRLTNSYPYKPKIPIVINLLN